MKYEEIKNAVECCGIITDCGGCYLVSYCDDTDTCSTKLAKDVLSFMKCQQAQINRIVKVVRRLTYDLRTNMTSITRYVRHTKSERITQELFKKRHIHYHELAEKAVSNILNCINENPALSQIEKMQFDEIDKNIKAEIVKEVTQKIKDKLKDNEFECENPTFKNVGDWILHEVVPEIINEVEQEMIGEG